MKLGLVGHPVAHSLSAAMHTAALRAVDIPGSYTLLDTPPAELAGRMQEVRAGFRGINVTIPHKEAAITYLDQVQPEARAIGAVNTVVNDQGLLLGYNTDAGGFLAGLEEAQLPFGQSRAVVLGAGGAARAVVYALIQVGCTVTIANRTAGRAQQLAHQLGCDWVEEGSAAYQAAVRSAQLLVNTTSVGLKDPHTSPLPEGLLPQSGVVVDIVYNPAVTRLMAEAQLAGLPVLGGLPMLVWQGALAFELWTGIRPPIEVMYEAARTQLGR
jgi:shikimate dehydrogenase